MSKLKCKCGNIIPLGAIPNPDEWLLISDVDFDEYSGNVDSEKLYKEMKSLFLCKKCSRIWVYWNGLNSAPIPYSKDVN